MFWSQTFQAEKTVSAKLLEKNYCLGCLMSITENRVTGYSEERGELESNESKQKH